MVFLCNEALGRPPNPGEAGVSSRWTALYKDCQLLGLVVVFFTRARLATDSSGHILCISTFTLGSDDMMDPREPVHESSKQPEKMTHVESIAPATKVTAKGIVLVPQPTADPRDPLSWPMWKKCLNLGIVAVASFAGAGVGLANAAGLFVQAELYHVSPVAMSYGISANIAGLAVGPLVWTPLSRKFGRSLLIFWAMLITLGTSVWGALCTDESDYISFVMSRMLAGLFGSVATTVGAGLILEVFYLHQRGKAFTVYSIMLLVGTVAIPTFSGFVVTYASWPVQLWYNVGLEALIVVMIFLFLQETGFTRPNGPVYPTLPEDWLANRMATFFFTRNVVAHQSATQILSVFGSQFVIAVAPVVLLCGGYLFVMFGWAVAVNNLLGVFLQTPIEAGGYGFTALENSYFLFTSWIAIAATQVYGHAVADRLPIYLCKRFGRSVWKPEYRLHALWIPGLLLQPIGLGLFGAGLRFHYHPAVLALGSFFITASAVTAVPVLDTYVAECFTTRAAEATACMNFYRLVFGLAVPFFTEPWIEAVGLNWMFGMQAFFSVLVFGLVVLLMFKGHRLRAATRGHVAADEEGIQLAETTGDSKGA